MLKNNKKKEKIETKDLSIKGDIAFTSFRKNIIKNHVIDVDDLLEMHGEIQRQWDKMKDIEKGRFLLNTPTSEREREYCICRKRFTKDDPSSPMVACNICDEWSHVECIRFSYTFVYALPFFVYPIVLIQHSQAFYRYIRHHAWEVINYEIKDISFTCKDFSKLNVLMRKVICLHKYPSQWKEMSILFTAPSLDILIHRGITN